MTLKGILSDHRWELSKEEMQCLMDADEELMRLRRIEAAVMNTPQAEFHERSAVEYLRMRARVRRDRGWTDDARYLDAIADELAKGESKCKLAK